MAARESIELDHAVEIDGETWPINIAISGAHAFYDPVFKMIVFSPVVVKFGSDELLDYLLEHEVGHVKLGGMKMIQLWHDIKEFSTRPYWVSKELHACGKSYMKLAGKRQIAVGVFYKLGCSFIFPFLPIVRPIAWFRNRRHHP
jgi:hypothetical protein